MINTPFDPTKLQPVLFLAPSMDLMLEYGQRLARMS